MLTFACSRQIWRAVSGVEHEQDRCRRLLAGVMRGHCRYSAPCVLHAWAASRRVCTGVVQDGRPVCSEATNTDTSVSDSVPMCCSPYALHFLSRCVSLSRVVSTLQADLERRGLHGRYCAGPFKLGRTPSPRTAFLLFCRSCQTRFQSRHCSLASSWQPQRSCRTDEPE